MKLTERSLKEKRRVLQREPYVNVMQTLKWEQRRPDARQMPKEETQSSHRPVINSEPIFTFEALL